MTPDFSFFIPAELIKSGDEGQRLIGGTVSTEDWDLQKEKVLQKGLDWSYVDGGNGVLKWEHSTDDPDNVIGFPLKVVRGEHQTRIIGELFKGHKKADSTWSLLKAIDEFNKTHSDTPRKIGWSIEGKYLRRDLDGVVHKAQVTNIVLTPNPVNTGTVATILKSLEAGYATSPEDQTGGGALRRESVEGDLKRQTYGGSTMFKDYDEAFKHYKDLGLSDEEAEAKAKEAMEKQDKGEEEPPEEERGLLGKALKIIEEQASAMKKSIGSISKEAAPPVEFGEDEIVDVTVPFEKLTKSVNDMNDRIGEMEKGIAETLGHFVEALDVIRKSLEKRSNALEDVGKSLVEQNKSIEEQTKMTKALANAELPFPEGFLEEGEPGEEDKDKLTKSQVLDRLTNLAEKGDLSPIVVTEFELTGKCPDHILEKVKDFKE